MATTDELFEGGPAPVPRTARVVGLVGGGLVVAVLGLGCSVLPGVLLVLAGWFFAEGDVERVDNGYLAADHARRVRATRVLAALAVLLTCVLVAVQFGLIVNTDLYDVLLDLGARRILVWRGLMPADG